MLDQHVPNILITHNLCAVWVCGALWICVCLSNSTCLICMFVWVAPSAVQDLMAVAEDSVSIRVSWRSPAQPNGPITQYRLQVLVDDILLQDITLTAVVVSQMLHLCTDIINIFYHSSVLLKIQCLNLSLFCWKGGIKFDCQSSHTLAVHFKEKWSHGPVETFFMV